MLRPYLSPMSCANPLSNCVTESPNTIDTT